MRKKDDWFLNHISQDDFDTNVMFFQYVQSGIYFLASVYVLFDRDVWYAL